MIFSTTFSTVFMFKVFCSFLVTIVVLGITEVFSIQNKYVEYLGTFLVIGLIVSFILTVICLIWI